MNAAKKFYYFFFIKVAYFVLRRSVLKQSGSQAPQKVSIVCRYGVQNGLTNGAHYHADALSLLGHDVDRVDITPAIKNPLKKVSCEPDSVFIFHCAAPQFLQQAWSLRSCLKEAKRIGYFAWEFPSPPVNWPEYEDLWDEIWVPSAFSAEGLSKLYNCPIHVVPHVLQNYSVAPRRWKKGGEPLTFLTMADARSGLTRKNPAAAVEAFQQAFSTQQEVSLIIKLQGSLDVPEIKAFVDSVTLDKRINVIMETLSREDVDALVARSHVYISLHRAEGFGLPLLEARMAGLATIATGWSGNMEFMDESDSVLVPYKLKEMFDESGVYGTVTWADPDVNFAAKAMQRMYQEPEFLNDMARTGWEASSPKNQLALYKKAIKAAGF